MINWKSIRTIYLKELRDQLRDRRTLISMIVIPAVVMPLLTIGAGTIMTKIFRKAEGEAHRIMVLGEEHAPTVVASLKANPKFVLVPAGDYQSAIAEKRLRAAVEIPSGFEEALGSGETKILTIYHYEGEMKSGFAQRELNEFFRDLREKTIERRLGERSLPASLVKPFELKRQNVAPPEKVGGNLIGGIIPYIIIILCFTGAMYPAIDLTAGEKERGTMETLLCSPVSRLNIVLGKFLMVLTASVATMGVLLVSTSATFMLAGSMFVPKAGSMGSAATASMKGSAFATMSIDPLGIVGVFAMVAPVAVLFAAVLLAVALFAKSYKEAQSYVSPLIIIVIMPAVIGMIPGIELSAKTALIPILNLSLVCKEMLSGVWNWSYIALIFGSSCLYAAVALGFAVKMFNREDVMFRA
jgi:sodium transport system permease protein